MLYFSSDEERQVPSGACFVILNPITCDDFEWLIGQPAEINGKTYTVAKVERYAHCPPFRYGERIGLHVVPVGA